MAGDTVAKGAVEATGIQIQGIIIFTLPDKHICHAQSKTDYIIMWSPHCIEPQALCRFSSAPTVGHSVEWLPHLFDLCTWL